ncbi:MAG: hypothetical protein Q9198_000960 [Flavoplaca austrocitrina]
MVPQQHHLQRGTPINIILKADQRSGKLTFGHIQDILTRGEHPHGIKVRLSDGRIGRVQSLCEDGSNTAPTCSSSSTPLASNAGFKQRPIGSRSLNMYEPQHEGADARPNSESVTSTSLMDYVKPNNTSRKLSSKGPSMSAQQQLEKTFPQLDSGLIAAILSDYSTLEAAEGVLGALGTA